MGDAHSHHHHDHHHGHDHGDVKNIKLAFALNLGFTLIEFVGGYLTHSLAIMSDAMHDLSDSLSLGMAWYLERYAAKGATTRFTYGYRRLSLLSALINTIVLITGSILILAHAIPRLMYPEAPYAPGMLILSIVGVAVNGFAALRMGQGGSMNARVVTWHLLEDVLGWVAVLVVSIILMFWDFYILDPMLSVLFTLYILYNVVRNLRHTLELFLQAVPAHIDLDEVEQTLRGMAKVQSLHHTHVWSLDGGTHVLTTHLVVDPETSREEVHAMKSHIRAMADRLSVEHITVDIEYADGTCVMQQLPMQK